MIRRCIASTTRALALGLAALGAAACASAGPAAPPLRTGPTDLVSAAEIAAHLGLARRPLDDAGKVVLTGADGRAILIFPDTTVASVRGVQFTTSEPVELRADEAWLARDDATAIESLWRSAAGYPAPEILGPPPLGPIPGTGGKPRPTGGAVSSGGAYGDQPTSADVRAWTVSHLEPKWTHIVIHHSATAAGSAAAFDAFHKSKDWDGLGYDFVIGNGNGSGDGVVEVGYRWRDQKRGAHAGNDYYNEHGIGICLVGDFTKTRPSAAQMRALSRLCNFLTGYCGIPVSNYRVHGDVRQTSCPGPNFPRDFLTAPRGVLHAASAAFPESHESR